MDRWAIIRQVAADTLRDFERRADRPAFTIDKGSYAVLEDVADECFQLTVVADPDLGSNVRGELDLDNETIRVRPDLSGARRVFTVAHEIGHRALEHPPRYIEDSDDNIDEEPHASSLSVQDRVFRAYDPRDRWELEANVFAAEILAPVARVRAAVEADPNWTVDGLAAYFGISPTAMRNQLATALLPGPPLEQERGAASETLDDSQREAATVPAPALVIAGPGAGKTRVLVRRFVHLVEDGNDPREILALTFSNKAAAEMRERLALALPEQAHAILVTTFHAFGFELLREYGTHIGLQPQLQLLTPADAFVFLRGRLAELPLRLLEDVRRPARHLSLILDLISRAKDELAGPADLARAAAEWEKELAQTCPTSEVEQEELDHQRQEAAECAEVARVYEVYEAWLREAGYVDYGDLITETVRLLQVPEVAADVHRRYHQILVDEFQDINYSSGRLVRALDGERGAVWAVADPKQSIYRFRGASPANLRQFKLDYPGASIKYLESNYRSVEDIVRCGQEVVIPSFDEPDRRAIPADEDPMRVPALTAERGRLSNEPAVEVISAPEWKDELSALAAKISDLRADFPLQQISVLCRTRNQAQAVAEALRARDVATNWDGSLEERPEFKDLMGVLFLAANDLRGLVRLARVSEHALSRSDLGLLLEAGRARGRSVEAALYAAVNGEIDGLSPDGMKQASELKALVGTIRRLPTAWRVLGYYLFERARWARRLFGEDGFQAQLKLATVGQVVNLTREFHQRSVLAGGRTTAHFLDFLQASLEAGDLGPTGEPLSGAQAVNVSTIHRSKGLEWSAVLVPQLADGRFPPRDNRKKLRLPPALLHDQGVADEALEQACIFYVALTRARDRLVLSRADRYPNGRAAPLRLLSDLATRMEGTGFIRETVAGSHAEEDGDEPQPQPAEGWPVGDEVSFRLLESYDECPRRFFYEHVLGLRDSDPGYPTFHDALYAVLRWIADQVASGMVPTASAVSQEFSARWEELGPTDHRYAPAYRKRGEEIAQAFAARLKPGTKVRLREQVRLGTGRQAVSVNIDEIEEGRVTVIRRHYFGPPAKTHAKKHLPFLFAAAHVQENGDAPYEVRNYYPLHGVDAEVPITARTLKSRAKKMEELAAQIEAGHFAPKPEEMRCSSCRFNFICPMYESD